MSPTHAPPFAPSSPADPDPVLRTARKLWQEKDYRQARETLHSAISGGQRDAALLTAAWAYGEAFTQSIPGRRISLVRRSPADLHLVRTAWQDRAFMERFHRMAPPLPQNDVALAAVLEKESQATLLDSRHLHWTIVKRSAERIGMVSMVDVSLRHRRAEFVVGVRDGTPGLALEASLLALEFAFAAMGLHKVCSTVYGENDYALRSTLHLGFRREGLLRDQMRDPVTGQFVSLHLSALFKEDFFCAGNQRLAQRVLKRLLSA